MMYARKSLIAFLQSTCVSGFTAALLSSNWIAAASAQSLVPPQAFAQPPMLTAEQVAASKGCRPDGDVTRNGNLVNMHLVVKKTQNEIRNPGNPNGGADTVELRSYGGCLTGPVIEAKPGNTMRILLENALPTNDPSCAASVPHHGAHCFNSINMHFHGLHVSPAGNSDNVLLSTAPGEKFQYEVNIPEDHPSGTYWYHAHRHGSTGVQMASGASGALIIRGDRRYTGGAPGDIDTILHDESGKAMPEKIFLFQQIPYACYNSDGKVNQNADGTWKCDKGQIGVVEDFEQQLDSNTLWETSGRFTSINGIVQPTITVPAGEIQRWRFIHGGIHDTVNLQVVPMVDKGPATAQAARGALSGTPKQQVEEIKQLCPSLPDDGGKPSPLVPLFEIASDGLTRTAINPIGEGQTSRSGDIGTNFMQPGYRSDVLIAFPHDGTYCMLNQAATPDERPKPGGGFDKGGFGPLKTQLLATIVVKGGKPISGDVGKFVRQALYDGTRNDKGLPKAARDGLLRGDLSPWRGMPDERPASNSANLRTASFYVGLLPDPGHPNDPKGGFGYFLNSKSYDPDRVDYRMQVNATEDWVLTSYDEPHIFHIHVNPFQIMDVLYKGKSVFGPDGKCLIAPDSVGFENQYCHLWHVHKDTIFVQNNYEVKIRTTYARYIGEFVVHCHVVDHEDMGMMANVFIVPNASVQAGGLGMPEMEKTSNGTVTQEIRR